MKTATIAALVAVVFASALALTCALEGCYRCDGPACSNIPSVIQPDYPPLAVAAHCTTLGVEADWDGATTDDAGVLHGHGRTVSFPRDAGRE